MLAQEGPNLGTSWPKVCFSKANLDSPTPESQGRGKAGVIQPMTQKGSLHLNWRLYWRVGKKTGKEDKALASYTPKIKDDAKHECHTLTGRVKANHAPPTLAQSG